MAFAIAGQAHKFMILSDLVVKLRQQLDRLRAEAQHKEGEAEKLVKASMNEISQWEATTEKLVTQINQARDEHVSYVSTTTIFSRKLVFPLD
mgnify:FL=1